MSALWRLEALWSGVGLRNVGLKDVPGHVLRAMVLCQEMVVVLGSGVQVGGKRVLRRRTRVHLWDRTRCVLHHRASAHAVCTPALLFKFLMYPFSPLPGVLAFAYARTWRMRNRWMGGQNPGRKTFDYVQELVSVKIVGIHIIVTINDI